MIETAELRKTDRFDKDAEDLESELRQFVRSRVRHVAYHPQLLKIIMLEMINGGSRFEQIDSMMRMFFTESLKIVEEMEEVKIVRDFNMKDIFFIMSPLLGGRFLYPNFDKDFDGNPIAIEDAIDAHTDMVMKMIYRNG